MQQLGFYSPQWLYSTCFGRQSHPSCRQKRLTPKYINIRKPYTAYVLLMMGEIVARNMVRLSPETCRVKPLRRIKTQLLHLVGLTSPLWSMMLGTTNIKCALINLKKHIKIYINLYSSCVPYARTATVSAISIFRSQYI